MSRKSDIDARETMADRISDRPTGEVLVAPDNWGNETYFFADAANALAVGRELFDVPDENLESQIVAAARLTPDADGRYLADGCREWLIADEDDPRCLRVADRTESCRIAASIVEGLTMADAEAKRIVESIDWTGLWPTVCWDADNRDFVYDGGIADSDTPDVINVWDEAMCHEDNLPPRAAVDDDDHQLIAVDRFDLLA